MSKSTPHIAIVINLDHAWKRHHEVFGGIHKYVQSRGWQCSVHPFAPERWICPGGDRKFDGIIGRVTPEIAASARKEKIPLVNVWYSSPVKNVPTVTLDAKGAGKLAGEHLRSRGFSRFAFLGLRGCSVSQAREKGFSEAIGEGRGNYQRLTVPNTFARSSEHWLRFQNTLGAWMDTLPTPSALFAAEDTLARHCANVALSKGLEVPNDLALVGSQNERVICQSPDPSLTSVEIGYEKIGFRAAEMLDGLMHGKKAPAHPVYVPPAGLLPRTSSDSWAIDDPIVAQAMAFIAGAASRPIKVKDVIDHIPLSGRSLARRFQETRGCRIIDEIVRMRMLRAKRLLGDSKRSIKEIAVDSGFSDATRLAEAFRKAEGMTPMQYRELQKSQQAS